MSSLFSSLALHMLPVFWFLLTFSDLYELSSLSHVPNANIYGRSSVIFGLQLRSLPELQSRNIDTYLPDASVWTLPLPSCISIHTSNQHTSPFLSPPTKMPISFPELGLWWFHDLHVHFRLKSWSQLLGNSHYHSLFLSDTMAPAMVFPLLASF